MDIGRLESGDDVGTLYDEILAVCFPDDELCRQDQFIAMIEARQPAWVARDGDQRVLGGAVFEWDHPQAMRPWQALDAHPDGVPLR